jgi:hypothetical protein
MEQYTEKLPVTLSEEEKQAIAEVLTSLEIKLSAIEKDKAEYNKDANEQIKSLRLQALELSNQYQTTQFKDVECYFVFDQPEEGQKTIYRSDTGAQVRVTDMNFFDNPENNSVELDLEEDQPKEQLEPRILLLHEGYINAEDADFEETNSETPPEVEEEFQDKAAQINEEKLSAEQAYNDLPDEDNGDYSIANSSSL